jgi:hypothetical protein
MWFLFPLDQRYPTYFTEYSDLFPIFYDKFHENVIESLKDMLFVSDIECLRYLSAPLAVNGQVILLFN